MMFDRMGLDYNIVMVDWYNSILFISPSYITEVQRDLEREKRESVGILAF